MEKSAMNVHTTIHTNTQIKQYRSKTDPVVIEFIDLYTRLRTPRPVVCIQSKDRMPNTATRRLLRIRPQGRDPIRPPLARTFRSSQCLDYCAVYILPGSDRCRPMYEH